MYFFGSIRTSDWRVGWLNDFILTKKTTKARKTYQTVTKSEVLKYTGDKFDTLAFFTAVLVKTKLQLWDSWKQNQDFSV